MPVQCVCQNPACGKPFQVPPSERKVGKGKFCSVGCSREITGKNLRKYAAFTCENSLCRKVVVVSCPSNIKRKKFCSRECYHLNHPNLPEEQRFWQKVRICLHGPYCPFCCWPWGGGTNKGGYGIFQREEEDGWHGRLASRVIWEFVNKRPLPEELYALHHCDQPGCCSIWHIYPGTQVENMRDMQQRGRGAKGNQYPFAKLTPQDIPLIFQMAASGSSRRAIARMLSVTVGSISQVLEYKSWVHISRPLNGH